MNPKHVTKGSVTLGGKMFVGSTKLKEVALLCGSADIYIYFCNLHTRHMVNMMQAYATANPRLVERPY